MRKISLFIATCVFPLMSFAWVPPMSFAVNQNVAMVHVQNPTPYPAYCTGYVYGTNQYGVSVNSWFSSFIAPYTFQTGYVYANGPYYFVNAWAQINCSY